MKQKWGKQLLNQPKNKQTSTLGYNPQCDVYFYPSYGNLGFKPSDTVFFQQTCGFNHQKSRDFKFQSQKLGLDNQPTIRHMRVYGILPRYSWDRLTVNNNVIWVCPKTFFCNLWQFRENEVLNHQFRGALF